VLEARLIGDAWLALDGRPVEPATRKGRLLLWILAVEERAVPRVELAELLWGRPRAPNLRQELHRLGGVPGADRWLSVRAEVRIDVTSDLGVFRRHLRAGRPGDAVAVWRGARTPGEGPPVLLAPVDATGMPAVEDWLQLARVRFEDALGHALYGHAEGLEREGRAGLAIASLHELLEFDPLNESAHRAVMRLEFRRGRFQAALMQFDRCRRALHEGLGVAPLPETVALAGSARDARGMRSAPSAVRPPERMPTALLRPPRLLGREAVWQRMERAWEEHKTIFLSGVPASERRDSCSISRAARGDTCSCRATRATGRCRTRSWCAAWR